MTDRVNALVVVLEHDVRTDDVEPLVDAIRQLRGVASVATNISDYNTHAGQVRAYLDIRERMFKALAKEGEYLKEHPS